MSDDKTTGAVLTGSSDAAPATDATTTALRRALYLKLFSGELFKGFLRYTIARDLITKRTLKNGRSLQFIFTGRTNSEFHVPGQNILGNTDGAPPVAEVTIQCCLLYTSDAADE